MNIARIGMNRRQTMKLATTIRIYAGGPGSGCNPAKGKCGRKSISQEEFDKGFDKIIKKAPLGSQNPRLIKEATKLVEDFQPIVKEVDDKLLAIGGKLINHTASEADTDPYAHEYMLKYGKEFSSGNCSIVKGEQSACLANVKNMIRQGKKIRLVSGYALTSNGIWERHYWGLDDKGKVIETTVPRTAYFGFIHDRKYSDWLEKQDETKYDN